MGRKLIFTFIFLMIYLCYSNAQTNGWYESAQSRIDSLRKGNFSFRIVDINGTGMQDSMKIIHKKHEFPWGTAIDLKYNIGNSYSSANPVIAASDSEIYRTERWASYLAYYLPAEKGKDYKLTIKLSENYFSSANARLFDVYVDGQKVLANVDKYVWAGGKFLAVDTTITVYAINSSIKVEFSALKDNASVMGLILSDSEGNPVLRLNCGGLAMTTENGNFYMSDLNYLDKNATTLGTSNDDWIKSVMLKYCNYGVCGNQFKWSGIESSQGQLNYGPFENTLGWFQKVGWNMRAHTLLWGGTSSTDYHELPKWVGELSPEAMYDTCKLHVMREVTRYKGIVKEYDVLNEPTHATYLQSKVGDSINWNCFKWAHEADSNARLFVNEYNIVEWQDQTDAFIAFVKKILQHGAPVHGIGSQCHMGTSIDIPQVKARFDQLAQFGLPIKVTEFDMAANNGIFSSGH
jgi:GH35 family endo-1,4-beta-xylanase